MQRNAAVRLHSTTHNTTARPSHQTKSVISPPPPPGQDISCRRNNKLRSLSHLPSAFAFAAARQKHRKKKKNDRNKNSCAPTSRCSASSGAIRGVRCVSSGSVAPDAFSVSSICPDFPVCVPVCGVWFVRCRRLLCAVSCGGVLDSIIIIIGEDARSCERGLVFWWIFCTGFLCADGLTGKYA